VRPHTTNKYVYGLKSFLDAGNLLKRAAFETERNKVVLDLAQRKVRGENVKLSAAQLKAAAHWQHAIRVLFANLLKLDGMLKELAFDSVKG
jgi:hypothetical protein